jgi:hypothetical protein
MAQAFKSMSELTEYLEKLEARVRSLEQENELLRPAPPAGASLDGNAIARYVSRSLPQTSLLSPSFFKRAFTVWGHFFVANLVISLFFFVLYACLMMAIFGSTFGNLIQNQP